MYKYIFFDLDGTLTDPGEGITNSVAYALDKFGIEEADRKKLYKFIGPPLAESFMRFYNFDEEKALLAVEYFREYFKSKGIFENEIYESVPKLLEELKKDGKLLVLATSKPEVFAKRILAHFELDKYFFGVYGATLDSSRVNKKDVISYAINELGIKNKKEIIMIGDREHDVWGAKGNGVDSIGVSYGYGSTVELEEAGADHIADTPKEIYYLLSMNTEKEKENG